MKSFSHVRLCDTPQTAAHQAPLSTRFSRQEYWSGLPFPSLMTNLDSIKSRDITLPTNVRLVKDMVFPVVMCGCESWTIQKAEHRRIDAFELWCWRRLLRVPLDCKQIQPVHSKGDQPWVYLEAVMLKLKLQFFGHLMRRVDSLEKTGRHWGQEEKGTTEDEMGGWHH